MSAKVGARPSLEDEAMAHRYRYYVMFDPVLHDLEYDDLERRARAVAPLGHPIHGVGSSLASSYEPHIVELAMKMSDT